MEVPVLVLLRRGYRPRTPATTPHAKRLTHHSRAEAALQTNGLEALCSDESRRSPALTVTFGIYWTLLGAVAS